MNTHVEDANRDVSLAPVTPALRELIAETTNSGLPAASITLDSRLFDDCGLDSTSIVQLILAIEERLGIAFDESDLDAEAFQTLRSLANLVVSKQSAMQEQ
jgi:acyl carrier protein